MGVALCNQTSIQYHINHYTLFPLHPSLQNRTCHILPPSEIDWGLCLAVCVVSEGNLYFTEVAERVECGNHENAENLPGQGAGPVLPRSSF